MLTSPETGATYDTNDVRWNKIMVLLDALDGTTPDPVSDRIVIRHPLQPFDVRNVTRGALGMPTDTPFTFDPTALTAAEAASADRGPEPGFLSGPVTAPVAADVALSDLTAFVKDPVKGFFRALDYTLPWDVDGVADAMPVEIDALQEWVVGDRMLQDMLRGHPPDQARQMEWRRGSLPPGRLGWRKAQELRDQAGFSEEPETPADSMVRGRVGQVGAQAASPFPPIT
mgnify:CR=1 FL=1